MFQTKTRKPRISVVVVFHNMRREAERTLYSLSTAYQNHVSDEDYDVIAVDSNSSEGLGKGFVSRFGPQFKYLEVSWAHPSPCRAMNRGVRKANGDIIVCAIDGARIWSPGILSKISHVFSRCYNPFVFTIGMHLGPKVQNESIAEGYTKEIEDQILKRVEWKQNGYSLFGVSSSAASTRGGFFSTISESNCFAIHRKTYDKIGGFDERFVSPGGGLVNLDIFNKFMEFPTIAPVLLLGEATFHQLHGGVATNSPIETHPWKTFAEEYRKHHGREYKNTWRTPMYYGDVPQEALHLLV